MKYVVHTRRIAPSNGDEAQAAPEPHRCLPFAQGMLVMVTVLQLGLATWMLYVTATEVTVFSCCMPADCSTKVVTPDVLRRVATRQPSGTSTSPHICDFGADFAASMGCAFLANQSAADGSCAVDHSCTPSGVPARVLAVATPVLFMVASVLDVTRVVASFANVRAAYVVTLVAFASVAEIIGIVIGFELVANHSSNAVYSSVATRSGHIMTFSSGCGTPLAGMDAEVVWTLSTPIGATVVLALNLVVAFLTLAAIVVECVINKCWYVAPDAIVVKVQQHPSSSAPPQPQSSSSMSGKRDRNETSAQLSTSAVTAHFSSGSFQAPEHQDTDAVLRAQSPEHLSS